MLMTLRNALLGMLLLGFSSTALAQEEAEVGGGDKPISVGLLLGYGISFEDVNPWGLGFGLRGGYNIDAIFLGARFVYYLGESEEAGGFETSINLWELGIEGGYDIAVGPVIIRPGLGLGIANATASVEGPDPFGTGTISEDNSEANLYVALGGSVLYDINEQIFIGGDARLQFVLADESFTGFIILANGGMRF